MAKTKISEFSATPGNNTDIDGINIAEGCAPSGINDAIRELMSQLKDFQAGTAGDSFNGPVGTTTAAAGAFTTLSASSTVSGTGFSNYLASPPAIGGTAAAAGSFTTLTTSSTVTHNGGTANGVAYLNGSKVLTTGSALTFDGFNQTITAATNGVGFRAKGSASSTNIDAATSRGGTIGLYNLDTTNGNTSAVEFYNSNELTSSYISGVNVSHAGRTGAMVFGIANGAAPTEQMRLTSTGLGIGTSSPAVKFQIYGGAGVNTYSRIDTAVGQEAGLQFADGGTLKWTMYKQAGNGLGWYNHAASSIAMILDSSGNLGLGVTPSDTLGYGKALDIQGTAGSALYTRSATNSSTVYGLFAYDNNAVRVNVGAIGTNNYLRFVTAVGEAARIDSSGNLLVGTTSSKAKLTVEGQAAIGSGNSTPNGIYLYINDALSDNSYLSRNSNGTGTTTWYIGNQAITTSSDLRLKENIKPTERKALELLQQWEIVDHTWNDPSDQADNNRNSRGVWTGVIAQQVQPITPWLVNKPTEEVNEDGTINPWTMDFGYAVPLLVKAIQEQQAIINTLTARVTALESK